MLILACAVSESWRLSGLRSPKAGASSRSARITGSECRVGSGTSRGTGFQGTNGGELNTMNMRHHEGVVRVGGIARGRGYMLSECTGMRCNAVLCNPWRMSTNWAQVNGGMASHLQMTGLHVPAWWLGHDCQHLRKRHALLQCKRNGCWPGRW